LGQHLLLPEPDAAKLATCQYQRRLYFTAGTAERKGMRAPPRTHAAAVRFTARVHAQRCLCPRRQSTPWLAARGSLNLHRRPYEYAYCFTLLTAAKRVPHRSAAPAGRNAAQASGKPPAPR